MKKVRTSRATDIACKYITKLFQRNNGLGNLKCQCASVP